MLSDKTIDQSKKLSQYMSILYITDLTWPSDRQMLHGVRYSTEKFDLLQEYTQQQFLVI
jgi:hypothetical protein